MSQHATVSEEILYSHPPSENTKHIWKTFWILSALTIAELGIGLLIYNIHKGENPSEMLVLFFKGMVSILTLAKAYYIIAVFMHLGSEIRNFIMTVAVPMLLFVWFLIAFLWDGNSFKNLKNTDGGSRKYKTEQVQKVAPAAKDVKKKN